MPRTEFNLVRVIPAAATKTLLVGFFDVGDASNPGTITVLPPTDSNMSSTINNCVANGVVNGALPGCKFTNVSSSSGWNGKTQFVRIPIPNTYTCNASQAGWVLVPAAGLLPRRRQRHHHVDGADDRRPDPPHQVVAPGRTA